MVTRISAGGPRNLSRSTANSELIPRLPLMISFTLRWAHPKRSAHVGKDLKTFEVMEDLKLRAGL